MKKKLKIGLVVDQLLTGGVQLAAIEQVKELLKLGVDAKLLILMRKTYTTDFSYLVRDIPHQYLSDSYPKLFRNTYKFPIFRFFSTLHLLSPLLAPRVIKNNQYDLLIGLGTTTCFTIQAIHSKTKIPYIAVIHDPLVYILEKCYSQTYLKYLFFILKPLVEYFEISFIKDAKEVIISSNVHQKYLKKSYNVSAKVLGFGTRNIKTLPKKRGDYLISFGRWDKGKNPEFLLNLVKQIPQAKLIIAGGWTSQEEFRFFKSRIKQEGCEKRIKLIPHYTDKILDYSCSQARLWVYPNFEAFGLAGLEAAAHGLPIILPSKSGVSEYFDHGVHGYFPQSLNLNQYKKFIIKLSSNERLAYKMGMRAAKLVKTRFSWQTNTKNLLKIIDSALNLETKPKIYVLETGHALGSALSGGDKLMEPMTLGLSNQYDFSIIVPEIGAKHWVDAKVKTNLITLPKNRFDNNTSALLIFLTYCIRMFQTIKVLKKANDLETVYSSTNILPDVLPIYFAKGSDTFFWIARIHHLIPNPLKRDGRFLVNLVSYLMQIISIYMIRNRADLIIPLNNQLKQELINQGFNKQKMKILGAGIDYKRINNQKVFSQTRSYDGVFLGRLHRSKGIFDLIPIWKNVISKLPNAKLAIIGDGPEYIKKNFKKNIIQQNLASNIFLLGYLPDTVVYSLMKKSKVFLFTDHEAGWGIAVAEAMSCGLPIVGYDNGVLGNVYRAGYEKIPLLDTQEFAKQVIRLLKNDKKRNILGSKAKIEAAKLDWTLTTKQFESILTQTVTI